MPRGSSFDIYGFVIDNITQAAELSQGAISF